MFLEGLRPKICAVRFIKMKSFGLQEVNFRALTDLIAVVFVAF
jgi:hypothetical protein